MLRCMLPALRSGEGDRNLLALLTVSTIAIGLFYGTGLFYGERTRITIMEYWRRWVVHLLVDGSLEVLATAALAFIFPSSGLVLKRFVMSASPPPAPRFIV